MPFAETGLDRDADLLKAFPVGSDVEVAVLEVDPAGRRIRVSKKAVAQQREQAELREYSPRQASAPARRSARSPTSCARRSAAADPVRGRIKHTDRSGARVPFARVLVDRQEPR